MIPILEILMEISSDSMANSIVISSVSPLEVQKKICNKPDSDTKTNNIIILKGSSFDLQTGESRENNDYLMYYETMNPCICKQ